MEALLEREGTVESWNDERMDELSRRMDAGFEKAATKDETNLRFDEDAARSERFETYARTEFHRIGDRLDKLFYGFGFFGLTLVLNLAADRL